MPHAAFSGAPARIVWSAASKSRRKKNAARPIITSEKTIASGPPSRKRSGRVREQADHQVDEHQRDRAESCGDEEAGELRRHPDGAGLVHDEHAEEHAESSDDGLADQRTGADTGTIEIRDDKRERANHQALECGVAEHDRRVVLLAAEDRDEHKREATEHADQRSGAASARFCATRKYDATAATTEHSRA